jgi:ABC-type lipoprotein export system ATPase subunit
LLGFGDLSDPTIHCHGDVVITDVAQNRYTLWNDDNYDPTTRQHIAFLPQAERLGFLDGLSVRDNLALFSHLAPASAAVEIEKLAKRFHLNPLPERLASASGGERIRLSAIRGLIPRTAAGAMPTVVIADEPTAGLDRRSAESMARSLIDLARSSRTVVLVITHEPELFIGDPASKDLVIENVVRIVECTIEAGSAAVTAAGTLRLDAVAEQPSVVRDWFARPIETLSRLGAVALSPVAFVWGLVGLHRPLLLARQVGIDASGPGTQAFSLTGCLLIAGTVAYFIFERMPKPELVEPLLLPEMMAVTGTTLVRMVLPLGACGLVTTKLGAAQAARLAAAVRGGLLETLAQAGWRVEAYALVPAVLAQFLAMLFATMLATVAGVLLAGVVYVAGHDGASLPLTVDLMVDGIRQSPHWREYALAKIAFSSFLGGTIAALYGIVPARAEDDVARAVHRTLLWSVLAVIACQCCLVLAEFAP